MLENDKVPFKESLNLDFLESDDLFHTKPNPNNYYKILIVDDDEEVHKMTKLVLKGFELEGTKIQFFDTYSGQETVEFLDNNNDIAIILLDVVMEENDSGLKVVKYLREELKNNTTRVIVRTGQPGKAPEEKIVAEYAIDDYKTKTELTVQKLYSTMYVCLRAHNNIKALNREKEGLFQVIHASRALYQYHSFADFLNGMLQQVICLYDLSDNTCMPSGTTANIDGLAFVQMLDSLEVLAATGQYSSMIAQPLNLKDLPEDMQQLISTITASDDKELILRQGDFLGIYRRSSDNLIKNFIILETQLTSDNLDLIKLLIINFSLAIDNFLINMNVNETQNEIIFRISEIVENRSLNTANHLRRVSNIVKLLSQKLGFDNDAANSIALASVMHDVGKIGIRDDVLLKPAKLTPEEFERVKKHTIMGYNILKGSKLKLLDLAANIALYHHERFDGLGYPMGKRGGEISKECEIVAVADVFDALISKRVYKDRWSESAVIEYFNEKRGSQFAPDVVDVLLANIDSVLGFVMTYPDAE